MLDGESGLWRAQGSDMGAAESHVVGPLQWGAGRRASTSGRAGGPNVFRDTLVMVSIFLDLLSPELPFTYVSLLSSSILPFAALSPIQERRFKLVAFQCEITDFHLLRSSMLYYSNAIAIWKGKQCLKS